jgi:hypothetical protein
MSKGYPASNSATQAIPGKLAWINVYRTNPRCPPSDKHGQ